uniref:Uncharacterized protein n=1 Tax=Denticeps clupeoides TaxID=299321 RepID=A0AAY4BTS2_9TELE
MLNSYAEQWPFSQTRWSNNRSVMPLDVRGCTRATMGGSACVYPAARGTGNPLNPTLSAGHKLALIKSLPFVHTGCRYYRLDGLVRSSDQPGRAPLGWQGPQEEFYFLCEG